MPRHLISDAHEWINEIPTVPIYYLANLQPRERAWKNQRGKKTLLSLTLVRRCEMTYEVKHKWEGQPNDEIPLLVMLFYLFRDVELLLHCRILASTRFGGDLRGRHRQVGSLAGAAHLLNDNTGVLRSAQ